MDFPDFQGALHIVHNGSAAGLLKQALRLRRDDVLESEDPLDCGPTPDTDDLGTWRSVRERYLRSIYFNWPKFSFEEFADNGLLMNACRLRNASKVIVWMGLGLPEQLLLAWVVQLFDRLGAESSKIRVVQFKQIRGTSDIRGIGELSPQNIRDLCPAPRSLNSVETDELRRVWDVYTSNDPKQLSRYVHGISPLPSVHKAVRQLIFRYPDCHSGIGVWEESLLRHTREHGPKAAHVIGSTMAYAESLDHPGDMYLFNRLTNLAAFRSPLLSAVGSLTSMRDCEVTLTALGERVLSGEANNVHVNGIDDWIGGVHLNDHDPVTFRDGDKFTHG